MRGQSCGQGYLARCQRTALECAAAITILLERRRKVACTPSSRPSPTLQSGEHQPWAQEAGIHLRGSCGAPRPRPRPLSCSPPGQDHSVRQTSRQCSRARSRWTDRRVGDCPADIRAAFPCASGLVSVIYDFMKRIMNSYAMIYRTTYEIIPGMISL